MQRRERHEKQDTHSPHPCNLSLEKYKLTKKTFGSHDLRLITEFMSATRAENLLLSTHGSFTKKREAGTVDLVLGDPLRFQPPLNESEREREVGRVGKGEPQEREYGGERHRKPPVRSTNSLCNR